MVPCALRREAMQAPRMHCGGRYFSILLFPSLGWGQELRTGEIWGQTVSHTQENAMTRAARPPRSHGGEGSWGLGPPECVGGTLQEALCVRSSMPHDSNAQSAPPPPTGQGRSLLGFTRLIPSHRCQRARQVLDRVEETALFLGGGPAAAKGASLFTWISSGTVYAQVIKHTHFSHLRKWSWVCPSGPGVKTPSSQCRGTGSIPGRGTKILHAARHGQKKETKRRS